MSKINKTKKTKITNEQRLRRKAFFKTYEPIKYEIVNTIPHSRKSIYFNVINDMRIKNLTTIKLHIGNKKLNCVRIHYYAVLKKHNINDIKVVQRNNELFLTKK